MRLLGYSTGAIALGDFSRAISLLAKFDFRAIELSALRISEVEPLLEALPTLDLGRYDYVSFHAPSAFREDEEEMLISLLSRLPAAWPIIVHPDAILKPPRWTALSDRIAIENMDRRKSTGRSVPELRRMFEFLPKAKMCFDLGHARQVDPSMVSAYELLTVFADRIVQLHVSEVDTLNRHDVISRAAEMAFFQIRQFVPKTAVLILESRVEEKNIREEANKVECLFDLRCKSEYAFA
jgi:Xylose isomerase-like TIM barrel